MQYDWQYNQQISDVYHGCTINCTNAIIICGLRCIAFKCICSLWGKFGYACHVTLKQCKSHYMRRRESLPKLNPYLREGDAPWTVPQGMRGALLLHNGSEALQELLLQNWEITMKQSIHWNTASSLLIARSSELRAKFHRPLCSPPEN